MVPFFPSPRGQRNSVAMIILAIDTSASLCAACVYDSAADRELGREVLDIGKGHAERLIGVIDYALRKAKLTLPDMDAVAVSVGPGSFTGVRVGVSTARGFALALKIPAVGVTTLDAVAEEARAEHPESRILVALDAGRGEINLAVYEPEGSLCYGPAVATLEEAVDLASRHSAVLAGSAAEAIAASLPHARLAGQRGATADILTYARLAARQGASAEKPKPLYLRAADAKPQAGFVLPRRDG